MAIVGPEAPLANGVVDALLVASSLNPKLPSYSAPQHPSS